MLEVFMFCWKYNWCVQDHNLFLNHGHLFGYDIRCSEDGPLVSTFSLYEETEVHVLQPLVSNGTAG